MAKTFVSGDHPQPLGAFLPTVKPYAVDYPLPFDVLARLLAERGDAVVVTDR